MLTKSILSFAVNSASQELAPAKLADLIVQHVQENKLPGPTNPQKIEYVLPEATLVRASTYPLEKKKKKKSAKPAPKAAEVKTHVYHVRLFWFVRT